MLKVSVSKARAIVVLAEEGNADQVCSADQIAPFNTKSVLTLAVPSPE